MDKSKQADALLKDSGAVLVRDKVHQIWRLPDGRIFVRSKTCSDRRAHEEDLRRLREVLGITNQGGQEGERREKKPKQRRTWNRERLERAPFNSGLADALRLVGAKENVLKHQLEESQKTVEEFRQQVNTLEQACDLLGEESMRRQEFTSHCWWCRLRLWWSADE